MAFWVFLSSAGMGISVFVMIYLYFLEQNKIMERAVGQIRDYLSGERDARIECDSEGELYRPVSYTHLISPLSFLNFSILVLFQKLQQMCIRDRPCQQGAAGQIKKLK